MDLHRDAAEAGVVGVASVKTRDLLLSVLRSEGNCSENTQGKGCLDQIDLGRTERTSQASKSTKQSDGFQSAIKRCSSLPPVAAVADLSSDCDVAQPPQDVVSDAKPSQYADTSRLSKIVDNGREPKTCATALLDLDLNVADTSQIADYSPFQPGKKLEPVRPIDPSGCGNTTCSLDNVSLKRWKAMKQNGFFSLNRGDTPLPKEHVRQPKKRKVDTHKKMLEIERREQAQKIANVVGPSGLLSGLNPGIMNHVRNRKQVLSIIAAMVKSETLERQKNDKLSGEDGGRNDGMTDPNKTHGSIIPSSILLPQKLELSSKHDMQCDSSGIKKHDKVISYDNTSSVFFSSEPSVDLTMKLSTGVLASESASQASNDDDTASKESIAFLSVKGANIASQWLELLRLDIKGRLAALRRSRKRFRNAIQTELPYLLSKGQIVNLGNNTHGVQFSDDDATLEMHLNRWKVLFCRMDKELSEEGKHLEAWLEQVSGMVAQCDMSLSSVNLDRIASVGLSDSTSRSKRAGAFDAEFAVRAAAASIYSTCTLTTMSKENVPCY